MLRDDGVQHGMIRGHLDGFEGDGTVRGWAVIEPGSVEQITIEIFENARLVTAGFADHPRPDVAEAGIGSGQSGFIVPLPPHLFDGFEHELDVWAKASAVPSVLLGSARVVLQAAHDVEAPTDQNGPSTAERERQEEVSQIRADYLEDILAGALARVDELEHVERALHAECDRLRSELSVSNDQLLRQVQIFSAAPHRVASGTFDASSIRSMSVTRRRDVWLNELSSHGVTGSAFALYPHDGLPGPLVILVWGSGGIGDVLYSTAIVRELARRFVACTLFVLNENSSVREIFGSNPYVAGTISLEGETLQSFVRACHSLDIFDLIVEVRYAVTYSTPPLSRAPMDFVRTAAYRSAEWQTYVRYRWPHLNNLFANEVTARGMMKLDLVGWTAMLPIDRFSPLDLFVDFADHVHFPELRGIPYVTIHHGSDKRMASTNGQQTKNLPLPKWDEIVPKLQAGGYKVVQLGEAHEELVSGIDHDFRGRTSLERTTYILKTAAAHLDSEGGLVHLARSVNTRSVVAFGPTPLAFFGYPANRNIAPPVCGNCWWTTDTWSKLCPRHLGVPECMAAHSPETLASAAIDIASRSQCHLQITSVTPTPAAASNPFEEAEVVMELARENADVDAFGAVLVGPSRRFSLLECLEPVLGHVCFMVLPDQFKLAQHAMKNRILIDSYGPGNVPLNTASLDWVVAIGFNTGNHSTISTLTDLGRCLKPGGRFTFIVDANERDRTAEDLVRTLIDTNALRPGTRFVLERGPHVDASKLDAPDISDTFSIDIRKVSHN